MKKPIYLYKSILANKTSNGHKWRKGVWYHEDDICICKRGFHASENIVDAMYYVTCGYLAKVEVRGKSIKEKDKQYWSDMRVVAWKKWTRRDSLRLAIYAAEQVLPIYEKQYPKDNRPRLAIEATKVVLRHDTKKNREAATAATAASYAASYAASSAASTDSTASTASAASAASYAASSAASTDSTASYAATAASYAASYAASSADSTDSSATKKKIHNFVLRLKKLK